MKDLKYITDNFVLPMREMCEGARAILIVWLRSNTRSECNSLHRT